MNPDNIRTISSTEAFLILHGRRGIPEIRDEQLKKLIPLLCQDLNDIHYTNTTWKFGDLVAIEYDHFTMWLLRWTEENYHIEKYDNQVTKYIKEALLTQNLEIGSDYDLRLICANNTELVISIEFTN